MKFDSDDTIAAIATPLGESAIGIIRISGKDALRIADKIFLPKDKRPPSQSKGYTVHYGWIVSSDKSQVTSRKSDTKDKEQESLDVRKNVIDEVLLTVMRSPRSYTREDVVEIGCHGGMVALRQVLELALDSGCRLAQPGEFTRRAFLNGRIDLSQAEAVLDIIRAKTDSALSIGIQQLQGALAREINRLRDSILQVRALLEAHIDFPEEQIGETDRGEIIQKVKRIYTVLQELLTQTERGRIYREGIRCVICGRPNVGKSSLLNALLKHERSIVTPVAGTTRDTIEEIIDIRGIPVRIVDTAGIIRPRGVVAKKAFARTQQSIDSADLVVLMFDASSRLTRNDAVCMKRIMKKKKPLIAVLNKIDLKERIEKAKIKKACGLVIELSAKKSRNLHRLEEAIENLVCQGKVSTPESILVSNARHVQALKKSGERVSGALDSLSNELSFEFIAQDMKEALGFLDDIVGMRFSHDLLDRIFDDFCIGK